MNNHSTDVPPPQLVPVVAPVYCPPVVIADVDAPLLDDRRDDERDHALDDRDDDDDELLPHFRIHIRQVIIQQFIHESNTIKAINTKTMIVVNEKLSTKSDQQKKEKKIN